jgi:hypothetical protein
LLSSHGYQVLEVRHANMLPLSLTGTAAEATASAVFAAGKRIARVPLLRRVATNIELVALAP